MKRTHLLILVLILLISFDGMTQGCSQCKLVAEQASEMDEDSFGNNINFGILYLMAVPYLLLFLFFRKKIVFLFKTKVLKK